MDGLRILKLARVNIAVVESTVKVTQNMEVSMTEKVRVNMTKGILTYISLFVSMLMFGFVTFIYAEKPPENILKKRRFRPQP
jgi:predicted DNA-binding transcriptional regulator